MSLKRRRTQKKPAGSYKVGYGLPPTESRFQPGRSGNPHGRPKHQKDLRQILLDESMAPVRVNENGQSRSITKLEAVVKQILNQAANGNMRAIQLLLRVCEEADLNGLIKSAALDAERPKLEEDYSKLSDEELLALYRARVLGSETE